MKLTLKKQEAEKLASIIASKARAAESALNDFLNHIFNRAWNEGTLDEFYDRRENDKLFFENYNLRIFENNGKYYVRYHPDGMEILNETESPLHQEDVETLKELLKKREEEMIEIEIN